jgi:hypothetical protein
MEKKQATIGVSSIHASFIAAQAEFGAAVKGAVNPHFKSRYADLSAVLEAVLPALNKHGLGLLYRVHDCDVGVRLEAVVVHTSGEELSSGILHLPVAKNDSQAVGSALSYGKRYLATGLFALQTADDDGNAATASMKTALDTLKAYTTVVAPKPVRYDISALEGDTMLAAEKFLQINNAKHLGDGRWESPAPLTRLDKYQY